MDHNLENKKILQGRQTRERVLRVAINCFAEKGYSACSMDDIAAAAGLSKGGLYAHFKSKSDLFVEMIKREHLRAARQADSLLSKPPYLDGLIWHFEECVRNAGFPMDHRLWAEVLAVCARDPKMKEVFSESEKIARGSLKNLIRKAMENGEISPDTDVEAMSILIFALGDGLIARIADDPDFDFDRHFKVFESKIRDMLK